ncbi:MAG: hypothetical protein ABI091_18675 [Ferruginibacter sp.]
MKFYLIAAASIILFSSCLKQSIPDAILSSRRAASAGITATLSYKVNGQSVNMSLPDAINQNPLYTHSLYCRKMPAYLTYDFGSSDGAVETTFIFYTDSLTTKKYTFTGGGDVFFIDYNNINEYAHAVTDSLNFTITSYDKGLISGSFYGQLTPYNVDSNSNGTWGASGSTKITEGTFKNVPVFY